VVGQRQAGELPLLGKLGEPRRSVGALAKAFASRLFFLFAVAEKRNRRRGKKTRRRFGVRKLENFR
jgi:hypothetical protein